MVRLAAIWSVRVRVLDHLASIPLVTHANFGPTFVLAKLEETLPFIAEKENHRSLLLSPKRPRTVLLSPKEP